MDPHLIWEESLLKFIMYVSENETSRNQEIIYFYDIKLWRCPVKLICRLLYQ